MNPPTTAPSRVSRDLVTWLLLGSVYALTWKLGLALASAHPNVTAVWPPSGLALAALLILGRSAWPGIFLGAFFVNHTAAGSLFTSSAIATGNTLEALIGAYLVNRLAGGRAAPDRGSGLAVAARVITAWRKAEEIGRQSERRLQALLAADPACVTLVSSDGLILDMNPAGLDMIGAANLGQVAGRPIVDLVHPEDRGRFLERHRAASSGVPARWEFRIIGPGSGERRVETRMVPLEMATNGHQAPRAVLGVTSDISGRKRLEDQLRQSQKMDALGRAACSITHDFNNFLTAIIGFTELALGRIDNHETVDPDLQDDLHDVLEVARRAEAVTRQLLIFSRSPMAEPAPAVSVDAVIAPLDGMLKQLLNVNIRLQFSLRSGDAHVCINPRQVEQIVMNLATNARDAMPHGGVLTIETALVHLADTDAAGKPNPCTGSHVQLRVSDTGAGMDENVKAQLFEPFFTTKAAGEGTGLGLATVDGIVKQSGGHIWVYSEPGHGTTFTLYFPLVQYRHSGCRQRQNDQPTAADTPESLLLRPEGGSLL